MDKNSVSAKTLLTFTWKVSKEKKTLWETVDINFQFTKFKPEAPYYFINTFSF